MVIHIVNKIDFPIRPHTYSKYSIIQTASRKLTDEELILAISGIIKQSHDRGLQDVRKLCQQIYGKALPKKKKLDYIISRLLHHLRPDQIASENPKPSDVRKENLLKIKRFLKQNKNITHVDLEKAPLKKEAITVKKPEPITSWDQSPNDMSLAVKSSAQRVAKPADPEKAALKKEVITVKNPEPPTSWDQSSNNMSLAVKSSAQRIAKPWNYLQKSAASETISNKSKLSATSQVRIKKTPVIKNSLQKPTASENISNKGKLSATSQVKRTPEIKYTVCVKGVVQNTEQGILAGTKIEVFCSTKITKLMYTSNSGEYKLEVKMKLNGSYSVRASKTNFVTEEKNIKLENAEEKVINVNFNLEPHKTRRGNISDLLPKNSKDLESLGYNQKAIEEALKKTALTKRSTDYVFNFLP